MKIPKQLQNTSFRFALCGLNSKKPIEKQWTTKNCYHFFEDKLLKHLKANGNYNLVCGWGGLIIIDFDNLKFYNQVAYKLPPTFVVRTAGKQLFHLYYTLNEKDKMFKEIAIQDKKGNVLCDIQANKSACVGPGSTLSNRRRYEVANNKRIAEISINQLLNVFGEAFKPKQTKEYSGPNGNNPKKVEETIKELLKLGVKRTDNVNFRCPFHPSQNGNSLTVMPSGNLFCFHESKHWFLDIFIKEFRGRKK